LLRARGASVSGLPDRTLEVDFDLLGASLGTAVISGALSVLDPPLGVLTAVLAILAVAGWCHGRGRGPGRTARPPRRTDPLPLLALVVGGLLFVGFPFSVAPWGGFALGLSGVPLWFACRRGIA
jgi:hypothetical protein